MLAKKNMVVSIEYQLFDLQGKLIEKTSKPISYLHGGFKGIFEVVEKSLDGKQVGDSVEIRMEPEDAFGDFDEKLILIEPRDKFPSDIKVGMQFQGHKEESGGTAIYTVTDIAEDKVVVDGNHPLAGVGLLFKCKVKSIRAATAEEISHGHVHGEGGHHH
jgi:FKBP-type peptidyl-prolyl cis-trans isomerase SlyD